MARHRSKPRQRAVKTRRKKFRTSKNKFVPPRTVEEYFAMPDRFQDMWDRISHVITKMRADSSSLPNASREFGLDPRTVARLGRTALRKRKNGRYAAIPIDQRLRVEVVPTSEGLREIGVPDSRQASLLGKYWNAVHQYLETGDALALQEYHGQHITGTNGTKVPLITDRDELDRLGSAGDFSFESIYARAA